MKLIFTRLTIATRIEEISQYRESLILRNIIVQLVDDFRADGSELPCVGLCLATAVLEEVSHL